MERGNEEKFRQFIAENPLMFSERRMQIAKEDFYHPCKGKISDELAEFICWSRGLPARHKYFGDFLLPIIRKNGWRSILEVGAGEAFLLSKYLYEQLEGKVSFTVVDQCDFVHSHPQITLFNNAFRGTEDLSSYDAVIAQEPCEAAELILKACTEQNKTFFVILCGVPHQRLTGELDEDVYDWYAYLMKQYQGCRFKLWKSGGFTTGCIYSENGFADDYSENILYY